MTSKLVSKITVRFQVITLISFIIFIIGGTYTSARIISTFDNRLELVEEEQNKRKAADVISNVERLKEKHDDLEDDIKRMDGWITDYIETKGKLLTAVTNIEAIVTEIKAELRELR